MVFEPGAPPSDREGFLIWFRGTVRLQDGHLTTDPSIASPALRAWYRDMKTVYAPVSGPDVPADFAGDDERNTDYRFADSAIFARFGWEVSRKAYRKAMKLAQLHGLGLFDASGDTAAVWTATGDDRFLISHRGEKIAIEA